MPFSEVFCCSFGLVKVGIWQWVNLSQLVCDSDEEQHNTTVDVTGLTTDTTAATVVGVLGNCRVRSVAGLE